ncbi:MAG: radical SAM protein [Spirochaetales bacterium]|nr:radical SAM protein [Spirochaetales bacterium]
MFTNFLRLSLAHSLKPFRFTKINPETEAARPKEEFLNNEIGLYIHVPFCRTICDFCPYNKELYTEEKMRRFIPSLLKELSSGKMPENYRITSLYFGGGSPALAIDYLPEIMNHVRSLYGNPASIGMELHPENLTPEILDKLNAAGVNMVSVGSQSFEDNNLKRLGRTAAEIEHGFTLIKERNFNVVDTDLIFAIPGQSEDTLVKDFTKAARLGATQISTYPFIRFSYTGQNYPRPSRRLQRRLLDVLADTAEDVGFDRTSVWTFAKKDSGQYSSVTRNNFIGFGPSATSLFRDRFCINSFSLDEYCRNIDASESPRVLELKFSQRVRQMYWLFWSCYNLKISKPDFANFFNRALDKEFAGVLKAAQILKLIAPHSDGYSLTRKGALWFHRVEQVYTHQYIDKTWRTCSKSPRPEGIELY